MEYVLQTKELTKVYGKKTVINKINMNVPKGSIYGLIGKNGAGKTTILRMITGLCIPTSGSYSLFDSINNEISLKRSGALIEQPALYKKMTAEENLQYYRILYGIPEKKKPKELLEVVGLKDVAKKNVGDFSLGMKQRLGIALTLLGSPDLLILDEPINGLDPSGVAEVRELINKLNREHDITVIVSSHILSELYKIATHYGIVNEGCLVQELTIKELNEKCQNCIKVTVDNIKKATTILETKQHISNYDIPNKDVIRIFDKVDIADINTSLVNHGIRVSGLCYSGNDIENYFLDVINGGEKNA